MTYNYIFRNLRRPTITRWWAAFGLRAAIGLRAVVWMPLCYGLVCRYPSEEKPHMLYLYISQILSPFIRFFLNFFIIENFSWPSRSISLFSRSLSSAAFCIKIKYAYYVETKELSSNCIEINYKLAIEHSHQYESDINRMFAKSGKLSPLIFP